MNATQLSEAHQELLIFMNETDSKDIAIGLRKVFNMALFENNNVLASKQKDDLFYLEKIISIAEKI
jgi:hypothetical protein